MPFGFSTTDLSVTHKILSLNSFDLKLLIFNNLCTSITRGEDEASPFVSPLIKKRSIYLVTLAMPSLGRCSFEVQGIACLTFRYHMAVSGLFPGQGGSRGGPWGYRGQEETRGP